jgi:hypothetical protein
LHARHRLSHGRPHSVAFIKRDAINHINRHVERHARQTNARRFA